MDTARSQRLAIATALGLLVLALLLALLHEGAASPDAAPSNDPSTPAAGAGAGTATAAGRRGQPVLMATTLRPRTSCTVRAQQPFRPVEVSVPGTTAGAAVLPMPRDADDVPGVPPLTTPGKYAVAWDDDPRSAQPGASTGNVLLNAHTWPDGTALGNKLLARLDERDRVILRGADGQRLCYRVTARVQVRGDRPYPRYYRDIGRPQLAIVVCSGKRTGPGEWSHRTVWFARPIPARA